MGSSSDCRWVVATSTLAIGLATGSLPCHAQLCGSMHNLGFLPGGTSAEATGVSADGSVVVGRGPNATGIRAWRWVEAHGMHDVGFLGGADASGFLSRGNGVSADGSIVVGQSLNPWLRRHGFLWSQGEPTVDLGSFTHPTTSGTSEAFAVSADGAVVVGSSDWLPTMSNVPFRWSASKGMQDLGLGTGVEGAAYATSSDGSVIVGSYGSSPRPFRWTAATGLTDLGMLPERSRGWATGVSSDGSVVVGWVRNPSSGMDQAFRWTAETGMESIGSMGGHALSVATGVSSDGSVIVGYAFNGWPIARAFRWTATSGMQDIGSLGGELRVANAVSADGKVIVGYSTTSPSSSVFHAFRWIAEPTLADYDGDYLLQVIDFLNFIDDFGSCQGQMSPCGQFGNPDINGDTTVDVVDFLDFMDAFGRGC